LKLNAKAVSQTIDGFVSAAQEAVFKMQRPVFQDLELGFCQKFQVSLGSLSCGYQFKNLFCFQTICSLAQWWIWEYKTVNKPQKLMRGIMFN
jgi:hypothetical protein